MNMSSVLQRALQLAMSSSVLVMGWNYDCIWYNILKILYQIPSSEFWDQTMSTRVQGKLQVLDYPAKFIPLINPRLCLNPKRDIKNLLQWQTNLVNQSSKWHKLKREMSNGVILLLQVFFPYKETSHIKRRRRCNNVGLPAGAHNYWG